jgi:hypothetical protein
METKKCYYCGDDAETKDHIVPVSYYHNGKRSGRHLTAEYGKENLIDCCKHCNSIAGNKVFDNIDIKKEFIQNRLWEKYKKLINMPNWTDEELNEIDMPLRKEIKIKVMARKWILNRINYPMEMFSNIELKKELLDFLDKEF